MSLQITIPADLDELGLLGSVLRRACREAADPLLLELAVGETVANAIQHGGAAWVRVRVEAEPGYYALCVLDDGPPFSPLEQAPLPLGELREGGYGLGIVRAAARDLSYCRRDNWNQLGMRFERAREVSHAAE